MGKTIRNTGIMQITNVFKSITIVAFVSKKVIVKMSIRNSILPT